MREVDCVPSGDGMSSSHHAGTRVPERLRCSIEYNITVIPRVTVPRVTQCILGFSEQNFELGRYSALSKEGQELNQENNTICVRITVSSCKQATTCDNLFVWAVCAKHTHTHSLTSNNNKVSMYIEVPRVTLRCFLCSHVRPYNVTY